MAAAGVVLVIVAFVLLVPRGSIPGSIAARNVEVGGSHIERTPGYQEEPTGRSRWVHIGIGLGLLATGVLLMFFGLAAGSEDLCPEESPIRDCPTPTSP